MSYFYSTHYAAWVYYPYPYSAPTYDAPRDRSYATAPSVRMVSGLPPIPHPAAPTFAPPPLHPLAPSRAAVATLVRQGFQSVPAPHTAPTPLVAPTAAPRRSHQRELSLADLAPAHSIVRPSAPRNVSERPPHPPSLPTPGHFAARAAPVTPLAPPAPPAPRAAPAPTVRTVPGPPTVQMVPPSRSHQRDLESAHLALGLSTPRPSAPSYLSALGPPAGSPSAPGPVAAHATPTVAHAFVPSVSALTCPAHAPVPCAAPCAAPAPVFAPPGPPSLPSLDSVPPAPFFASGWADLSAPSPFFSSALSSQLKLAYLSTHRPPLSSTAFSSACRVEEEDARPSRGYSRAYSSGAVPPGPPFYPAISSGTDPPGRGRFFLFLAISGTGLYHSRPLDRLSSYPRRFASRNRPCVPGPDPRAPGPVSASSRAASACVPAAGVRSASDASRASSAGSRAAAVETRASPSGCSLRPSLASLPLQLPSPLTPLLPISSPLLLLPP
jgi:hypothetical protein